MRGIGNKLPLLLPGGIHRANGPVREQRGERKQRRQRCCANHGAGLYNAAQRLLFAACIGKNDARGNAGRGNIIPQVIVRKLADGFFAGQSCICYLFQKRPVGQVIVA